MTRDPSKILNHDAVSVETLGSKARFELRRLPYPYRAMLAICSDLDETPNRQVYWETLRFLNTKEPTIMGCGVGLEVGNTIYFDMPANQFAYWNTDDAGREMVRNLIRSGHIDCLHSFGDLATSRKHAARALEELTQHDCQLTVWIDHGIAPSNFGSDIMQGYGDVQNSEVYHADLTYSYGIRYVWRGRVTSVIGQNVPTKPQRHLQPTPPGRVNQDCHEGISESRSSWNGAGKVRHACPQSGITAGTVEKRT